MKKLLSLLLALAMCVSLFACAKTENPPEATPSASPTAEATVTEEAPEFVTFTDSANRTVEIPTNITKISPSGSLAQMFLIAIAPDLLVTVASGYGESDAKYVPAALNDLPVVGQFYGSEDLNFESIAAIGSEIVIDIGEPKKTIVEDMDSITTNLAIPAIHITATLDSAPEAFRTLGTILNREAKGEELAAFCERALAQTAEIMASVGDNKVSALYLLGDSGLNVLAKTSFHSEILDYVTDNLAVVDEPSSKGSGNETDLEQISIWDPEVILFAPGSVYGSVAADPTWSQLQAVKNNNFYEVPLGPYNWMGSPPSINRYLGMLWLTNILYPEFAVFNLYDQVKEYYNLFYGYDLSVADYDELTANAT
ncbi:MAG: ABC transporter substrate-binding protein [Oscillospiraceae bacterium]|jgi:iron complex transport system substrate-binding protein|nr:ABC transporter substrate-binding protein [Oscillospiraceae bacterium]